VGLLGWFCCRSSRCSDLFTPGAGRDQPPTFDLVEGGIEMVAGFWCGIRIPAP